MKLSRVAGIPWPGAGRISHGMDVLVVVGGAWETARTGSGAAYLRCDSGTVDKLLLVLVKMKDAFGM